MFRMLETSINSPFDRWPGNKKVDIIGMVDELYKTIEDKGIDYVYSGRYPECDIALALPRKCDFLGMIYCMRFTNYIAG